MWSKIYFAVLGLSIAVMAFFTFYSWSWLQSIGMPSAAAAAYEYHSGIAGCLLVISSIVMLLLANAILWATKRAWAMWLTVVYVAISLVVRYFWLGEALFRFKKENALIDGTYYFGPIIGVFLMVAMGVAVFANQFVSVRLQNKMYASEKNQQAGPETTLEADAESISTIE